MLEQVSYWLVIKWHGPARCSSHSRRIAIGWQTKQGNGQFFCQFFIGRFELGQRPFRVQGRGMKIGKITVALQIEDFYVFKVDFSFSRKFFQYRGADGTGIDLAFEYSRDNIFLRQANKAKR